MYKNFAKLSRGFTLVELSIVLVIVGLLIGGILVGNSLMEAAKVQKFAKRHSQFEIAINTFYKAYKSLPGEGQMTTNFMKDYTHCRFSEGDINNNGITGDSGYELDCFWGALANSGMLKMNLYRAAPPVNEVCPPSESAAMWRCYARGIEEVKQSYVTPSASYITPGNGVLYYRRFDTAPSDQLAVASAAFTASIDKKFDDGFRDTGNILSQNPVTPADCYTGSNYSVSSPVEFGCRIRINILLNNPLMN